MLSSKWYLLYTKSKKEDTVSHRLTGAGYGVLNPKLREQKFIRGRRREKISPLFPCYLFVKFDYTEDYRIISFTRGVRRIVGSGSAPAEVPDEIINSIQERIKEGYVHTHTPNFLPGEEVYIKAGPFQGFSAVFERECNGMERVTILLRAINARAVVDPCILAKEV